MSGDIRPRGPVKDLIVNVPVLTSYRAYYDFFCALHDTLYSPRSLPATDKAGVASTPEPSDSGPDAAWRVRRWAKERGISVNARGRLPTNLLHQYRRERTKSQY